MANLSKRDFFNLVRDDYFENLEIDVEGLESMLQTVIPVFGKLETVIIEDEEKKKIEFIDNDHADVIFHPDGVNPEEIDTDMSNTLVTLYLDKENTINIVEHSMGMVTPANKDAFLWNGWLIGKKVSL